MAKNKITIKKASSIFLSFTLYFYLLLFTLLPFLKNNFSFNSALYWFITAYFLFIPLFVLAIVAVRFEGNKTAKEILTALNIYSFNKKDWIYSIGGLFLIFLLTGIIFGFSMLLNSIFNIRNISTNPWFIELNPFQGKEKYLLLIWLPMFFFNIVGEEILWRGYVQNRLKEKYTWFICALLWMIFHLPFGIDLMIMLVPIVLIIPYIFKKTENTLTCIFIHGLYNGPLFILVALGLI